MSQKSPPTSHHGAGRRSGWFVLGSLGVHVALAVAILQHAPPAAEAADEPEILELIEVALEASETELPTPVTPSPPEQKEPQAPQPIAPELPPNTEPAPHAPEPVAQAAEPEEPQPPAQEPSLAPETVMATAGDARTHFSLPSGKPSGHGFGAVSSIGTSKHSTNAPSAPTATLRSPIARPPRRSKQELQQLFRRWKSKVNAIVNRQAGQQYPRRMKRLGYGGVVGLSFNVDALGRIAKPSVLSSSGHRVLDRAAVDAIRAVGRVPPPPQEFGKRSIPFPIQVAFRPGR